MFREKTLSVSEAMDFLTNLCKGKAWFYDVSPEKYGRPTVYVHYIDKEQEELTPYFVGGHQVLVHFAASKFSRKEDFIQDATPKFGSSFSQNIGFQENKDVNPPEELDIDYLIDELDRLERRCGANILESIFYEEHDGKNAVTNLSEKYPEVREAMRKLYDDYGFDLIFNELEG